MGSFVVAPEPGSSDSSLVGGRRGIPTHLDEWRRAGSRIRVVVPDNYHHDGDDDCDRNTRNRLDPPLLVPRLILRCPRVRPVIESGPLITRVGSWRIEILVVLALVVLALTVLILAELALTILGLGVTELRRMIVRAVILWVLIVWVAILWRPVVILAHRCDLSMRDGAICITSRDPDNNG